MCRLITTSGRPLINHYDGFGSAIRCMLALPFMYLLTLPAYSQRFTDQFQSKAWQSNDGLSLGYKNYVMQDVNGFIWITSPLGIDKFDGGSFVNYRPEAFPPGKKNSSYSFTMLEDGKKHLWIGTTKGLLYYDTRADSFRSILSRYSSLDQVTMMTPFGSDDSLVYCIANATSVVAIRIGNFDIKQIADIPLKLTRKNKMLVQQSVLDARGHKAWLLNGDLSDQPGLMSLDLKTGESVLYGWDCINRSGAHLHGYAGMILDQARNCIWLNTQDGLLQFSLGEKKFRIVEKWGGPEDELPYGSSIGIGEDRQGRIWVASPQKGIIIHDPETGSSEPLYSDSSRQYDVSAAAMQIYIDREDEVWVSYLYKHGLYQLSRKTKAVELINTRKGTHVLNLRETAGGDLIVGTDKGSFIMPEKSRTYLSPSSSLKVPEQDLILGSHEKTGNVWHRSPTGQIIRTDIISGKHTTLSFRDSREDPAASLNPNLCFNAADGIWVISDYHGMYKLGLDSDTAKLEASVPYHVTNFYVAQQRYAFFRLHFTAKNLCFKREGGHWVLFPNPIDGLGWSSIAFDPLRGSYWVGTMQEVHRFDSNFVLQQSYSFKQNDVKDIISLNMDKAGMVWFNSNMGQVTRLNPESGEFIQLSGKDGYTRMDFDWQSPALLSRDGSLFISGNMGILHVRPDRIVDPAIPIAYIKSIQVNNQDLPGFISGPGASRLDLEPSQTSLTLETGVLYFHDQSNTWIRYKLGKDAGWQMVRPGEKIQFNLLPPGQHDLFLQASVAGNRFEGQPRLLSIRIQPTLIQRPIFWLTSLSVLLLAVIWFTGQRTKRKFLHQLEASKKEVELTELKKKTLMLEQKALELEMNLLRSHMNPHFLFNSLNSVNRFILQNDPESASSYLTKFSKLIRMILHHTQEDLISLENELTALGLYLQLEAIRFESRFNYEVKVSPGIDPTEIRIPPLIIQPYVENAIWHGLMHKKDMGHLSIMISQENEMLMIQVSDDGVGRTLSATLDIPEKDSKSVGMKITRERILAVGKPDDGSSVQVTDLLDHAGKPAGTEVTIKIPMMYD